MLPTIYRMGDRRLAMFSTFAQFGAAEEVSLADMKIALMFPADEETRNLLQGLDGWRTCQFLREICR